LFQSEPDQHNQWDQPWRAVRNVAGQPHARSSSAVNLVEDITANLLRMLSGYLETYADQHPGLKCCVPIVTQGARCFAARDYAQTLA